MKLYCTLILFVVLSSCFHFDKLEYYVNGYSPNNDSLRTDGYYYRQSDSLHLDAWPDAIQYMYLLKNGTFSLGSNVENLDSLDSWLCDWDQKMVSGLNGFYTLRKDTICVEFLSAAYFVVPLRATRLAFKAVQTSDGLRVVEVGGETWDEEWLFHENDCVPDSVHNWITSHRKYKLN